MKKKIAGKIALLLLLASVLGFYAQNCEAMPSAYCFKRTYDYGSYFCDRVCSDGYFMFHEDALYLGAASKIYPPEWGTDCAHFVSCAIGAEPNHRGGSLPLISTYGDDVYGIVNVHDLYNFLIGNGLGRRVDRLSDLRTGDVILFDIAYSPARFDHSSIVKYQYYIDTHSRVRCNESITSVEAVNEYFFIQIYSLGDIWPRGAPDGQVDICDIIQLINFVLCKETPTTRERHEADLPYGNWPQKCYPPDGSIDILDIMETVDIVLSSENCVCQGHCHSCVTGYF